MALLRPAPVPVTDRERRQLEALERQPTCPQQLAVRARIILLASRDVGVRATADELGIGRSTVQAWRRRWTANPGASVAERLSDAPRPGTPPLFTAEQVCEIVALACEDPRESGRAITHWTQREVADEAMKRGIVTSISSRSIGRFFKISRPQAASHPRLAERQTRPAVCGETPGHLRDVPPSPGAGSGRNPDDLG
jgi:putative transposase